MSTTNLVWYKNLSEHRAREPNPMNTNCFSVYTFAIMPDNMFPNRMTIWRGFTDQNDPTWPDLQSNRGILRTLMGRCMEISYSTHFNIVQVQWTSQDVVNFVWFIGGFILPPEVPIPRWKILGGPILTPWCRLSADSQSLQVGITTCTYCVYIYILYIICIYIYIIWHYIITRIDSYNYTHVYMYIHMYI